MECELSHFSFFTAINILRNTSRAPTSDSFFSNWFQNCQQAPYPIPSNLTAAIHNLLSHSPALIQSNHVLSG
ncbi:unnamed protein product [Rhizoctonia solani]|nr:unnamed protein product [Rhizoctonia solani]